MDVDKDWQLDIAEFSHSLDPDFLPPKTGMSEKSQFMSILNRSNGEYLQCAFVLLNYVITYNKCKYAIPIVATL